MIETILTIVAFVAVGYVVGNAFPFGWVLSKIGKGTK